jgi:hypothetical protein
VGDVHSPRLQVPGRRREGQSQTWQYARQAVRRGTRITIGPLAEPEEASGRPPCRVSDRTMVRVVRPERFVHVQRIRSLHERNGAEEDCSADPEAKIGAIEVSCAAQAAEAKSDNRPAPASPIRYTATIEMLRARSIGAGVAPSTGAGDARPPRSRAAPGCANHVAPDRAAPRRSGGCDDPPTTKHPTFRCREPWRTTAERPPRPRRTSRGACINSPATWRRPYQPTLQR